MHIDRLKQILDDWARWMHAPSTKLGYPSKSLGMISGGESTSDAFEDMVSVSLIEAKKLVVRKWMLRIRLEKRSETYLMVMV